MGDVLKKDFVINVCQCCLDRGTYHKKYNFLNSNGGILSSNITYIEMLSSCFSLNLTVPLSNFEESYICDLCIIRLKDAFAFRSQVEEAQKTLRDTQQATKLVKDEAFNGDNSGDEHSAPEEIWDIEYLDEYEDIIKNPMHQTRPVNLTISENGEIMDVWSKKEGRFFNKSVVEKECSGRYTPRKWLSILRKKICKIKKQCLVCYETFQNFQTLNKHLNTHYPVFTCKYCGKSFANRERIDSHLAVHNIGPFKCHKCNMVLDTKSKWSNHVATHKPSLRHRCPLCPERFKDFQQRVKHLVISHNHPERPYHCKICGMTFKMAVYLSQHRRRVHLKERNSVCSICGKTFFGTKTLNKHMITHNGERTHQCKICNKAYARRRTLKEHSKIHTNEKRFICMVCERSFTQKCTLKGHMKTHSKEFNSFKVEEIRSEDDKSGLTYVYMNYKEPIE